jgi:2-methylisocitrate lyase-like PEP mutase family enzyme
VAGLSIEDSTREGPTPLYGLERAVERVRAARWAIDDAGADVLLTARCEGFLVGMRDLGEVVRRLLAYADAGADCLYAPGLRKTEDITAVVRAVAPKPVNVLVGWPSELTVSALAALGARRISVGAALARAAWGGFERAARELAERGSFAGFADASATDLDRLFGG